MLILIEGPDGAGKSTLATALIAKIKEVHSMGCVVQLLHKGPPVADPYTEYLDPLRDYAPGTGQHIVCDRWHLGEAVYPQVLGRDACMTSGEMLYIECALLKLGAIQVYITAPETVLAERLGVRGDDLVTSGMLAAIEINYAKALQQSQLWTIYTDDPDTILHFAAVAESSMKLLRRNEWLSRRQKESV
jgi:thymidylate kinase